MNRWVRLITGVLLGGCIMSVPCALGDEAGRVLWLKSPDLGNMYVYITNSKDGFALYYPRTGAKFVSHAPDWKIILYNDQSKTYFIESIDDLQSYGKDRSTRVFNTRVDLGNQHKGRSGIIANTPVTQYFINASSSYGPKQVEAWIANDIVPPKQLIQVLGKMFVLDTSNFPPGFPLRVRIADDSGFRETYYDTSKILPQMIRTAAFTCPVNYKHVNSELEVAVDEQSRKKMESILSDSDDLTDLLSSSNTKHKQSSYYNIGRTNIIHPGSTKSKCEARAFPAAVHGRRQSAPPALVKNDDNWWGNLMNAVGNAK